jgi:CDP-diacylglycerol---glycerol-3-phosphate 3-phosphatidyltransferase
VTSNPPAATTTSWLNWANAVTMLRVALVPVIGALLVVGGDEARWWAFGVFLFAAFTDTVDGWVARRAVGVTRWGQLADPFADKLLIIGSLVFLALERSLPWWAVAVIVVREAAVTLLRQWLLRRDVVMPASKFGKVKTVAQVVAVTLYLMPAAARPVAVVALGVALAFTVASGLEYVFRSRRLTR